MRRRASEALPSRHPLPRLNPKGAPPVRVSELVKRREAQALIDFQRAIEQREQAFIKLARAHQKVWKLGRACQRYTNRKP